MSAESRSWQSLYDELATQRYPRLLAYATALTGSRPAAEDLLHDALVKTFGVPRRFASAEHAEHYVRRAMVTGAIDVGRRRGTFLDKAARLATPSAAPDPASAVDDADAAARILASLAPRVRAVLVLRYYDDLTLAQIADQLGLATGTVKRYLSDGLTALGQRMTDDDTDDERPRAAVATSKSTPKTTGARA
jgi:RNA polymerase sigma factor (sigma-70 family)